MTEIYRGAPTLPNRRRGQHRLRSLLLAGALVAGAAAVAGEPTALAAAPTPPAPSLCAGNTTLLFGPNTCVFSTTTPEVTIQADLNAIAAQQVPASSQFDSQRYDILFEPGTYGSTTAPLIFQVGYYTEVAGLGLTPGQTVLYGAAEVNNQCFPPTPPATSDCTGLDNFWRSLSNLTINVTTVAACTESTEFWAASQAAPIRRVDINGNLFMFDYCSGPAFVSGGFIADSEFTGGAIINGGNQQEVVRNTDIDSYTNGVWDQVFSGDVNAPATVFGPGTNQYTNVGNSPVTREEPYLYMNGSGGYEVFVPAVQTNTSGTSWSGTDPGPGYSLPISRFFVANPSTPTLLIDLALALGKNLVLTPGVYDLYAPIVVTHPDTVVLGQGFATLVPERGNAAVVATSDRGVELSGLIIDAGPINSPVLLDVGCDNQSPFGQGWSDPSDWGFGCRSSHGYGKWRNQASASDPDTIQDIFFRIGGAETTPVSATVSLLDNADNSIIDDLWAWRADHGNAVGWTVNQGATGVIITGNSVTAYGLAVEHYQKYEVIWSGQNGTDIFFQNELPYDPPSQAAWMATPTQDGYPAFLVAPNVTSFQGYGMASYVVFIQTTATLDNAEAFEAPTTAQVEFQDLVTVWLGGSGGDLSIIDGTGGPCTSTNPGVIGQAVDLNSYS
jgi:hypothetical protein